MKKKNQSEIEESRSTDPWQHPASAKLAWSTGTRRELSGGFLAAAEFLITLSRKGEPLRAVAGRRIAGASHCAPRFRGFGVELGFVRFIRRSFVFSARSPRCPAGRGAPAGKGKLSCPGQGLSAPRRRRWRCPGQRFGQDGLGSSACSQRRGCLCRGVYGPAQTWRGMSALPCLSGPAQDSSTSSRPKAP